MCHRFNMVCVLWDRRRKGASRRRTSVWVALCPAVRPRCHEIRRQVALAFTRPEAARRNCSSGDSTMTFLAARQVMAAARAISASSAPLTAAATISLLR